MTLPSIGVIVPCWNAEAWVGHAIESVLAQDYPDLDIIVVDDGSTDGSLEVISSFGSKVRWETGRNRGACAARNAGLALIQSGYVLFLDADDYIEAPLLSSLARCVAHSSCDFAFGPSTLEYQDGHRLDKVRFSEADTPVSIFARILGDDWVPPHSILWRTEFIRSIGGWNERMVRNQDGELLSRALLKDPRLGFADEGCAVYVQHSSPDRVSTRHSLAAVASQIEHFECRAREAKGTAFENGSRQVLALHLYNLAQTSFIRGCTLLGRHALYLSRDLGFRGHRGTRAHRLAASMLGLELKEALSRLYWRIARKLVQSRSMLSLQVLRRVRS